MKEDQLMAVPVARIAEKAREINVAAFLLSLLIAPFYVLGWLAGKSLLGLAFIGAAVKVGWSDARGERSGSAR
jgi:hypothetical protein